MLQPLKAKCHHKTEIVEAYNNDYLVLPMFRQASNNAGTWYFCSFLKAANKKIILHLQLVPLGG
jgi:hypothetical protein